MNVVLPVIVGLAASVCEIAESSGVGVELLEAAVPVPGEVEAACGSRSQSRVRRADRVAAHHARFTESVVFPTPPLRL